MTEPTQLRSATAQPLVSIVTPVYNEEKHLAECIESILAQSYENWELVIVDNCSADRSVEIALRYAAGDERIRVQQNQEFLPAIANHNRTLRHVSPDSKYCKVVLSDDWIFPECLSSMVSHAEQFPSVGIVSAYALEGTQVRWTGLPHTSPVVSGREICRKHLLEGLYVFGTPTTVLYRSDLVRNHDVFYNEANIHADTEVCFALLKECDFGFVHQVLSFAREREGSLSNRAGEMHAYFGSMLHILTTYGPDYLNREELDQRVDVHLNEYYKFLGKSVLLKRDEQFWKFHKKSLTDAGVRFSVGRLTQGLLRTLCEGITKPGYSTKRLLMMVQ
jgi:glycosyltransferase involved in cell wall biosynthesis